MKKETPENVHYIPLSQINPFDAWHTKTEDGFNVDGNQTSGHLSSIKFIKKRILEGAVMRPILVMKMGNNTYQRLDGFCRYWAYKELGRDKIPCIFGTARGGQGNLNPFTDGNLPRFQQ